jgi:capsule biosynthesis phosphatase
MRICIDLDGVVCQLKQPGQSYADLKPVSGAVERLRSLRKAGHYIILFTARHMKTCGANVGMVLARQGKVTLDWLHEHGVEFDEIHFGKPHADVYLDDNAMRFQSWESIAADGRNQPRSAENRRDAAGGAPVEDPDSAPAGDCAEGRAK